MDFELTLIPETPDKLLLHAEKPLAGLAFIEEAGKCLRRSLDAKKRTRHMSLGNIATYTMSVPQALAIVSKMFEDSNKCYVVCEEDILEKFIFHAASTSVQPGCRRSYPFYEDEIVLSSLIDELAFLNTWRNRGYPKTMTINLKVEGGMSFPLVPDADDVAGAKPGDCVLDDLTRGLS